MQAKRVCSDSSSDVGLILNFRLEVVDWPKCLHRSSDPEARINREDSLWDRLLGRDDHWPRDGVSARIFDANQVDGQRLSRFYFVV